MFGDILSSIFQTVVSGLVQAGISQLLPSPQPRIDIPSFAPPAMNPTVAQQPAQAPTPGVAGAGTTTRPNTGMNFTGGLTGGAPVSGGQQPQQQSTGFTSLGNSYYRQPNQQPQRGFQGI